MNRSIPITLALVLGLASAMMTSGCSRVDADAAHKEKAPAGPRAIPVTVAPLERRTVERTVNVVGTLRGWEQVTIGSKRTGRVILVAHDMGDRVNPDEPLVELDPVDAKLAYDEAQSKYLAELVRLGVTEEQADNFVKEYGVSEDLIRGERAEEAISRVPAVVQVHVARERAMHNLTRQRNLSKKGASTVQELEDYENDYLTAVASYDNARATARNVIAMALANRIARDQCAQILKDMVIRVPTPEMTPPGTSEADRAVYAITKRSVAEGQFVREGDAVFEMVIENPLRLWTNVPERYADRVQVGQTVRVSGSPEPGKEFEGKVVRINPSVDPVSRTFQVETQIPNDRRLLRPGGFAKASIITDSASEASVVPTESIVQFAGVTKVFVIEDGKARAINDIVTREEGQGWVEVVSKSLSAQAVVVTTGQSQLADGTPVVVRVPETATDHTQPADAEPAETKADGANPAEPNSAEPKK